MRCTQDLQVFRRAENLAPWRKRSALPTAEWLARRQLCGDDLVSAFLPQAIRAVRHSRNSAVDEDPRRSWPVRHLGNTLD